MHEAQPRYCRHCERDETDKQIDPDAAMRVKGEDSDKDREPNLGAPQANQVVQNRDSRTDACSRSRRSECLKPRA
jgi:hypothetical protein